MKTEIITLLNQKGGVGKTTTTMNLGGYFSKKGYKVLLVDLDPQANLTTGFGVMNEPKNIYGSLLKEYSPNPYVIDTNLSILISHRNLSGFDRAVVNDIDKEFLLSEILKSLKNEYDIIFIDCPPSLGLLTLNALVAADKIIVPLEAQVFSIDGLSSVFETISKVQKRLNENLILLGIFLTKYDQRKILKKEMYASLENLYNEYLLKQTIRDNISLAEAPLNNQHIFQYDEKSIGAIDYKNLADELIERLMTNQIKM
jgi:chromosome partitioning protein